MVVDIIISNNLEHIEFLELKYGEFLSIFNSKKFKKCVLDND